jgi:alpha/beta superfamily hydrolase
MLRQPVHSALRKALATRSSIKEALSLAGPAGSLEALLETPRAPARNAAAVICHPHPRFQGTMMNKVVHTLARSALDAGVPALRFNFRGVGASEGEYAAGRGEADDALAAAAWALDRFTGAELWLFGFSFGAMVACRAALASPAVRLVTVAPPAERMAGILDGRQPACDWLVLQGDADDVVSCDTVVEWVNGLAPGPELAILPDVDHFFHGRLTLLRETVTGWLSEGGQ